MLRGVVAALSVAASSMLGAAMIDDFDVDKKHGRYMLVADARLDATPESIYAVLTDYDDNAFGRIAAVYKESRYLEPAADGTPIVYTRMEGCLLRKCMSLRRTERLETRKPYHIKSTAIPEASNFKYATSEWDLERDGDGTKLRYILEIEPDFFIPPLVGSWYVKRSLSQGGMRALTRIERLARQLDGRPIEPSPLDLMPPPVTTASQ